MKKASSINDFKECLGIGIDVSKAELVVVGLGSKVDYIKRLGNHPRAINTFLRGLKRIGYNNKIICESTGHYHLKLVIACHQVGLEIILLNPLQASKHIKAKIRKTKTDPEDALTLATMCITEKKLPKPAQVTASKALLRLKIGQLASLEKQLQKMNSSLNQYEETYAELGLELSGFQQSLREHYKSLKEIQQQLVKELELMFVSSMADDEGFKRLQAVPGYSSFVAGMVGQFDRQVKGADSWVAYVGLDVSVRESGTWKGRGKLTKRGNAYFRKRFFQSSWGATMNYEYIRAYYDQLKIAGRGHKEALCIISRKLLKIAYHVVVNKQEYDAKIAFPAYFS